MAWMSVGDATQLMRPLNPAKIGVGGASVENPKKKKHKVNE
jgi:hypothetical protein